MDLYISVLKKYAVFDGRARRKEYWTFVLLNVVIGIGLGFVTGLAAGLAGATIGAGLGLLTTVFQLAILVPSVAVGIRRMHDTNRSGWWLLVPIANLIFALTEGDKGPNEYGADPKAGA